MGTVLRWICCIYFGLGVPEMQARPVIFLFGPPGSGKGSIADYLQEQYGCVKICSGDLLRERIKTGDALGKEIRACIQRGQLVTDKIITTLIAEAVKGVDHTVPVVIDGYPQSLEQIAAIQTLHPVLGGDPHFIHIRITKAMALQRMLTRRICPSCGKVHTKTHTVCLRCHTPLVQREDDCLRHVAQKRLDAYEKHILPLRSVIQKAYPVYSLRAQKDFTQIQKHMQRYWASVHAGS